jgi:hypothetical protein
VACRACKGQGRGETDASRRGGCSVQSDSSAEPPSPGWHNIPLATARPVGRRDRGPGPCAPCWMSGPGDLSHSARDPSHSARAGRSESLGGWAREVTRRLMLAAHPASLMAGIRNLLAWNSVSGIPDFSLSREPARGYRDGERLQPASPPRGTAITPDPPDSGCGFRRHNNDSGGGFQRLPVDSGGGIIILAAACGGDPARASGAGL